MKCFYSRTAAVVALYLARYTGQYECNEGGVTGTVVQYAPNAPKGHRSILYMTIDKGHKDKGHKALCPLSTSDRLLIQNFEIDLFSCHAFASRPQTHSHGA